MAEVIDNEEVTVEETVERKRVKIPTLKLVGEDSKFELDRTTFMEHSPLSQSEIKSYEEYSKDYIVKATEALVDKVETLEKDCTLTVPIGTSDVYTITVTDVDDVPMVITEYSPNHLDIRDTLKKQESKLLDKLKDI